MSSSDMEYESFNPVTNSVCPVENRSSWLLFLFSIGKIFQVDILCVCFMDEIGMHFPNANETFE